ncbi:hypothetical protein FRC96_15050 [Lujinxingia vulgaris]|uniref:Uncharacterized protein n=1 Tax=Lujinxingia vulgaris TaxID=2600176 RepID=A0A5C6WWM2_9DELT|nr:hypothetical protein [Lujinxingia vulgaris]TXD33787.1 hypothetical protein FRC96_15050 [Lujinxingia vulgaris]
MTKQNPNRSSFTESLKAGAVAGAKVGLFPSYQIASLIADVVTFSIKDMPSHELADEQRRAELETQIHQARARAAQELALAERILTATEIEVEEYYEGHGEGGLGLNANAATETVSLGAHGSGRRVVRRVVRLRGWAPGEEEVKEIPGEVE